MAHVITGACVDYAHARCVEVCPVSCIHGEPGRDRMMYIDPGECIDCRGCAPECPTGAIFAYGDLEPDHAPWVEVNRLWYEDRDAARAEVERLAAR